MTATKSANPDSAPSVAETENEQLPENVDLRQTAMTTSGNGQGAQHTPQQHSQQPPGLEWGAAPSSVWDKIADPMSFAFNFGAAMAASRLFGLTNADQGRVLAFSCILERRNPLEMLRTFHVISNKLSMRSDAMLAEFRRKGGKCKWIKTGEDGQCASAQWQYDGNKFEIGYTIDDAIRAGLVKPGSGWDKNPDALLRARCTSKAIRMIAPEIVAGYYAPEDLGTNGEPTEAAAAEFVPVENVEQTPALPKTGNAAAVETSPAITPVTPTTKPAPAAASPATTAPSAAAPAAAAAAVPVVASIARAPSAPLSAIPSATPSVDTSVDGPRMVTPEQLQQMAAAKKALGLTGDQWRAIVGKRQGRDGKPLTTAQHLTFEQADSLIVALETKCRAQEARSSLDHWANSAINRGTEKAPFETPANQPA